MGIQPSSFNGPSFSSSTGVGGSTTPYFRTNINTLREDVFMPSQPQQGRGGNPVSRFFYSMWDRVTTMFKDAAMLPIVIWDSMYSFATGRPPKHRFQVKTKALPENGFLSANMMDETLPQTHAANPFLAQTGFMSSNLMDNSY